MKKFILLVAILMVGLFGQPMTTLAAGTVEQIMEQVDAGASGAAIEKPIDPRAMATRIITFLLTTVGTVFVILICYGGYLFLTAQGEEEKVKKGLEVIKASIVGLVVILLAYGITIYVGSRFSQAVIEGGTVAK